MQLETDAVLGSTTLNAMYAYWIGIKGGNEIPLRRDLDPTEIGPVLLPYSLLADVDTRTQSVRHRVVGTNFTDFFGRDITGMELSTVLEGNYLEFIRGLYMLACEQRVAVVSHSRFRWDQGRLVKASRLMMPLSKDGSRSDMCYTCQVFETGEGPMPPQVFIASDGATADGSPSQSAWEDVSQKFSHLSADVI
ncbi:PAS domain-containing protein [Roseovarius sp.]|uniref:PAS domain-containing protein n=1 Tax=Roseovarius sp. TaxID=1486281 RepID=UPI003A98846A